MAIMSGKDGTCNGGTDITSWSINMTQSTAAWHSSESSGFKQRLLGVKDATGSFSGKCNSTIPAAGDIVTALAMTGADKTWTLGAVLTSVTIECDVDDGDVISYSADWEACGKEHSGTNLAIT